MAVKGDLKVISLTNLVQMNAQSGLTGQLTVAHAGEQGTIVFVNGEITHAKRGDLSGKEAFYQILAWDDGEFEFDPNIVSARRTIQQHWSDLLISGMQHIDEQIALKPESEHREEIPPDTLGELFGLKKNLPSLKNETILSEDTMAQEIQEILTNLGKETADIFTAAVIGMDGFPLADYSKSSIDAEVFSAQMTLLIKLVDTSTQKLQSGEVEDYLLTTDKAYLLLRFLGDSDYYLGIGAIRSASNLGKLRLYSRIYAKRLNAVLPR